MIFRKKTTPVSHTTTKPRQSIPTSSNVQRNASASNIANVAFHQNAQHTVKKEDNMLKKQNTAPKPQPRQSVPQKMSPKPAAVPASVNRRANIPGYGNPHKAMAPRDVRDSRKLIVGREISLNGEINTCDHLVVEGTVKATIKGGEMLEVAHRGLFQGTVEIQEATIAGTYEGDLKVLDRLFVKSTGVIKGNIEYGEMEVESGARIDGSITSMGAASKTHANDEATKVSEETSNESEDDDDYEDDEEQQLALA